MHCEHCDSYTHLDKAIRGTDESVYCESCVDEMACESQEA